MPSGASKCASSSARGVILERLLETTTRNFCAERCARWRTGSAPASRLVTMAKLSKKRKDKKNDAKSAAKSAILGVVGSDAWKSTKRNKPGRRRLLKLGAKLHDASSETTREKLRDARRATD